MSKITGNDILKIALANPDIQVPADVAALARPRRNKYNAVRCELDGMKFDSRAEMQRCGELRLLELSGEITGLEHHPVLELSAGVRYEADFRYVEGGRVIIEDVKGGNATQTAAFRLKWKQAQHCYPDYEFRIVKK